MFGQKAYAYLDLGAASLRRAAGPHRSDMRPDFQVKMEHGRESRVLADSGWSSGTKCVATYQCPN